ncbi:bifunctional phosphopantothenoylcysteine decarboxylase/phosphopantothenate--cysteine ligase CoaBC [Coralliovum pocilloporae]|uniref:bifunctional phosphopantothenoylcysteine decarboxylase/phosphopantothenate--cysteine ligase CoaBC n=1 Tax=Coralliovum pocilloporae TaxID=3066369 RepID=UPI003307BB06
MSGKRILLMIAGGIAAYKSLELIRRLKDRGYEVSAVMTRAAHEFVTPLSVSALTGTRVHTDLFDLTDEAEMGHIQLSRSADLIVIAPATADLLAKMAHGQADDLASTLLLATDTDVLAAPAMNVRMWAHPATQRNLSTLRSDGVHFVGPDEGDMACGEFGPGRMAEPDAIADAVDAYFGSTLDLRGKTALVTSGPTHEPIDPVRYIANRSSGQQGHAIAAALARAGASVTLISGPVSIPDPYGVTTRHVETAREMLDAVEQALPVDLAVMTAAVADWRVAEAGQSKIKKEPGGDTPQLSFVENPDILKTVGHHEKRPRLLIGFAAETDDVVENARGKLDRKKADWIVANDVSPETGIMGGSHNSVRIVDADGVEEWPNMTKTDVATRLVERMAKTLKTFTD